MSFNLEQIKAEFPILKQNINGYPLVYLDNASTSQRPMKVINAENDFYKYNYAAVHRGVHSLSMKATASIEKVRTQIARFINANYPEEIIFVKGTTEGINLVANSWASSHLKKGDNIILTEMEHHANIVPWQMIAQRIGIEIRIIPFNEEGELVLEEFNKLIDHRTRLLTITHVSNVLGTINPVKDLVAKAKVANIVTLVDGAQMVMHQTVDIQDINCDFYVFSGHKIYGPNGIGILYGRKEILDSMPPWQGGGAMIKDVRLPNTTIWNDVPWCFEAGTPNIGGIIGLGAALNWINNLSLDLIHQHETKLMSYALEKLLSLPEIIIYGSTKHRNGIISFNLSKYHAFDIGTFLDQYGIAIRTGHHCAMPLMHHYGVSAMCRASFALYNSKEDIDRLVEGLLRIYNLLNN